MEIKVSNAFRMNVALTPSDKVETNLFSKVRFVIYIQMKIIIIIYIYITIIYYNYPIFVS